MRYKVGDRVKILNKTTGSTIEEMLKSDNRIINLNNAVIKEIINHGYLIGDEEVSYRNWEFNEEDIELINNNNKLTNKIMTLKEKFLLALKSEPEKSFRKTGITNGDDMLTSEGTELFLNFLFEKNKTEFKKEVVDAIIAEDEKANK